MLSILDQVAHSQRSFRPGTYREFFALQFARVLGDGARVRAYVALAQRNPLPAIIDAYHMAASNAEGAPSLEQIEEVLNARGE